MKQAQHKNTKTLSPYLYIELENAEFIETENGEVATEEQRGMRKGPQDELQLGS